MADAVNRIVPSSVGAERASWQGRERQKRKEKEHPGETEPANDRSLADGGDGGEPAPKDTKKDKGKYLDVNV